MLQYIFRKRKILLFLVLALTIYIYLVGLSERKKREWALTESGIEVGKHNGSATPAPFDTASVVALSRECEIPRIDPFSADVMAIWQPLPAQNCPNERDLFSVRYNEAKRLYFLHFNATLFSELFPEILSYSCVRYEVLNGATKASKWRKTLPADCADWLVPHHVEGIVVECVELLNGTRILQRDAFAFVQQPAGRHAANDEERSRIYPTIMMLGIDSMSQMNFQRAMPLTARFVRRPGWHEMLAFASAEDSTFLNLMILLTGLPPRHWESFCDVEQSCLDAITYLWNHFHNSGYLTAYADDSSTLPFTRRPVDYYLSAILKAFGEIMQAEPGSTCLGRRHRFRYVLDYSLQLLERFVEAKPAKPLFGLLWTSSFSHADFRGAASVDADFVDYLRQCEERGLFERAIVVLFSVNGQQEGPLMELKTSFFEERLPMLHVYLPPWYREKYPEVGRALELNRRRLCTAYDLNLSIKALLRQVHPGMRFQKRRIRSKPLFEVLPVRRGCWEAGISDYYCVCDKHSPEPDKRLAQQLAKLAVYRMGQFLRRSGHEAKCHSLELERLLKAERRTKLELRGASLQPQRRLSSYKLKFSTRPKAVFHATVLSDSLASVVLVQEYSIRRLGSTLRESRCVSGPLLRELCLCR